MLQYFAVPGSCQFLGQIMPLNHLSGQAYSPVAKFPLLSEAPKILSKETEFFSVLNSGTFAQLVIKEAQAGEADKS